MREIKFKGQATNSGDYCKKGDWVYGFPVKLSDGWWIWVVKESNEVITVQVDNICELTGLKDRNGKEIYEGDICKHPVKTFPFAVEFRDGGFAIWHSMGCNYELTNMICKDIEVIGNIYQHGHLFGNGK